MLRVDPVRELIRGRGNEDQALFRIAFLDIEDAIDRCRVVGQTPEAKYAFRGIRDNAATQ